MQAKGHSYQPWVRHSERPFVLRQPGPFEVPSYEDLPPGAKVLTVGIDDVLYVPVDEPGSVHRLPPDRPASFSSFAFGLVLGLLIGAAIVFAWGWK